MRPLGIPSFEDKLLQEVIRMILEAIYEGYFEYTSHGFRPNRSCHTALDRIQKTFTGVKWFIEGDIKGFFDNINHNTLIGILKERIDDERFLRLVRKFLNAGYIENWTFHNTYSGTPQGGIISPILANIYLDKFDKYVNEYTQQFKKGKRRMRTTEYRKNEVELGKARTALKNANGEYEREKAIARIRQLEKERVNIPHSDPMDNGYKRLFYVRYADDWLCGVIGSKEDCRKIKEDFKNFLYEKLQLELSEEKTLITNAQKSAKFLSYEIRVRHSNLTKRDKAGRLVRNYTGRIVLEVSNETIKKHLIDAGAMKLTCHNGKEIWKPKALYRLKDCDDLEILDYYNSMIRGFYNYYCIANNSSIINSYKYIMEYSIAVSFDARANSFNLHLGGKMMPKTEFGDKPTGIIRKIEHEISRLPVRLSNLENQLANLREQIEATKAELGKPFPQEEELQVKSQRLLELSMELDMDKGERPVHEDGGKDIAAKSERPSILEKLKQPAVHSSGQDKKKIREEVAI